MPVLADDDVIVNGDAERRSDIDDRARHLDIRLRGRRIAGGVIVHQQDRGGRQFQRPFYHFARIHRGVVDGAHLLHLVGDQLIALVENRMRNCSLSAKAMLVRQ